MSEAEAASEAEFHIHGTRSRSTENFSRCTRPKTAATGNFRLRIRPVDRFKGMSREEVMQYREWQREQISKKQVDLRI